MKKISEPVVFFGSGPVAAESLRLLSQNFTIEAVVTKPRPPHHKGDVPVLAEAERLGLPVHTAENKDQLNQLFKTKPFGSRLAILIDFGIIVSQDVIDYFPLGIINSHFSLLPEWRGADPITFSILSGQKQTGVSLMLLTAGLDEGPLLAQTAFDIPPDMTTPQLTATHIGHSYELLTKVVPGYLDSTVKPRDQLEATIATSKEPTYSRRLVKDDGLIDWSKEAVVLEREVRGYSEWPKSRTTLGGSEVTITKSHVIDETGKAGDKAIIDGLPVVYCGQQALVLDQLKPAGKQEMTGQAYLAGYKQRFLEI